MSLGNGPIFVLVKLDNSSDIIDFLILPAYLFFYTRQTKEHLGGHRD